MAGLKEFGELLEQGSALAIPIAFVGGLVASVTPCVYPVLPLLIGYMGSTGEKSRRRMFLLSSLYAVGMALTFTALGAVAALIGRTVFGTGRVFSSARTSWITHLVVGVVIVVFALSLVGVIRIPMPRFLARREAKPRRGYLGALLMGMMSGMITGPCVGAVAGPLLIYLGSKGNIFFGAIVMFAFAMGMGVLLIAVGTFTGLLAALPRSGALLRRIELGFALAMMALGVGYFILYKGILAAIEA